MIKIAFFNQKGGVGKTTSVVNLAATFAKSLRKKILVVDCDSQMTATNYLCSYTEHEYSIEDLFDDAPHGKMDIHKVIYPVNVKTSISHDKYEKSNINVLPSYSEIETLQIDDLKMFNKILSSADDYDFCFFDLPPHLSGISLSALVSCDYVIVPAHADTDSLSGYNYLIDTITEIREKGLNLQLCVLGVLFNDINLKRMIQKHILETSYADMGSSLFKTYIKSSSEIEKARYLGIPLPYTNLSKSVNSDYEKLAKEIVKRIKEKEKLNG